MADALSTPAGSATLVAAAQWIQGTLLGSLATAVAWIGFGMLTGRINLQRGVIVILGCFIVFGAPVIAAGLMKIGGGGNSGVVVTAPVPPSPPPPRPTPTSTPKP